MRALAAALAPDYAACFAECGNKPYFRDLIVTKCNHIFCKACLEDWFHTNTKCICPLDNGVLSPITNDNVKQKEEDPKIDGENLNVMEYSSFKLYLERFTYYIKNDLSSLKEKLTAEKTMKLYSCEPLKAANKNADPKGSEEDQCSICSDPFQMYFIIEDEDQTRVGRFMHKDCLGETVANKSVILDISVRDVFKVAEQLPPPRALPPEPFKPASPIKVFFIAIILPMSIWALAMNSRVYHNRSFTLFVLSIPALIIFKIGSLLWNALKAVFTPKHA